MRQQKFSVIVLDLMMPGMDGWEVVRRIAQDAPQAGVVIITAVSPKRRGQFDHGVVREVLDKPFDIQDLVAAVKRSCHGA